MSYDDETLIANVKALLKARKRSARSVSQSIGVPYRSMQNYLSGESRMPAVVLVKILDALGSDLRQLQHGDSLLRHADLFDAVYRVFGDYLGSIPLNEIGKRTLSNHGRGLSPDGMAAHQRRGASATELAIRLSEAYDHFSRDHIASGHMPTIKELREMDRRRLEPQAGDEPDIGQ